MGGVHTTLQGWTDGLTKQWPALHVAYSDQSVAVVQFGTGFTEMDAMKGRNQTTKGIWFAKSTKITEPVTMVMDLEGSDGRERGEDDTSFERQSSLFALAVADILLVNMWAKDIGREAGSGKPLLKTIFQVSTQFLLP